MSNDDNQDFSSHPLTVGELRSGKPSSARDWKPRDVLIDLLRDIDSGKLDPKALVVAMRFVNDDGSVRTSYRAATTDHHITVGVVQSALFHIQREGYEV